MTYLKSFFAFLLLATIAFSLAAQQTVTIPANTPLYKTPDPNQNPILILFEEKTLQAGETKNVRFTSGALLLPLKFHQVALPGAGIFWAAPGLEYGKEAGKNVPTLHPRKNIPLKNQGIGLLFLALLCAVIHFTGKLPKIRNLLPYAGIFFFCAGLTCYAIGQSGNVIQGQVDDYFYFDAARDILNGNFSGPWKYTIGFPLFYIPFILLQKATTFEEFYYLFLLFNALFISPLALCFIFAFFKKFTNEKSAVFSLFIYLLLAIFWQSRYFAVGDPLNYNDYLITSYAAPPLFTIDLTLYSLFTWFGVNCVSDTPAVLLLAASLYMFVKMKPTKSNLVLFSILFAFICLVRMNNIFYAPCFIFLYFTKYRDIQLFSREFFRTIVPPCIVFTLIISIQLLINHKQFGSPFTTPYILHDQSIVKWHTKFLCANTRFLFCCNKAWFLPAVLAVLTLKNNSLKTIYALWCFPVLFFFMGYGCTFNSPIRFLLPIFPIMALTIASSPLWNQWNNGRNLRLAATILACIALTCPWMPNRLKNLCGQWNFTAPVTDYLTIAGLIIASLLAISFVAEYLIYRRKQNQAEAKNVLPYVIYSVLFILLWIEPTAYGVFALSLGVFLYICRNLWSYFRRYNHEV